ncbi:SPW repeat protein [Bradyrhizobium sp.]|uniref:SPW repeat protein n=1 Tax=Bradyrhizobium sp. TaxID=376 RepID=UPI003C481FE4
MYNLVLAAVLFASPWVFALTNGAGKWDLRASSAVIGAIALAAIIAYANWEEWINLMLGLWLIVSPWVLGFAHTRSMHFSVGLGAVIAFLAALELFLVYDAAHPDHASRP